MTRLTVTHKLLLFLKMYQKLPKKVEETKFGTSNEFPVLYKGDEFFSKSNDFL